MTGQLIICDTDIRQDSEGRYCLNDLHKAAGGVKTTQPSNFMRRVETYALIAEIANSSDVRNYEPTTHSAGRYGGTYVCKEIVYAYAIWISPAFHLKVIRAYDTLQTQGVAVADHAAEDLLSNPLKYFRTIIEQAERMQERALQAETKASALIAELTSSSDVRNDEPLTTLLKRR